MKKFTIIKMSTLWSTTDLTKRVEQQLTIIDQKGYEIVSVAFGVNMWWMPTCYITVSKTITT